MGPTDKAARGVADWDGDLISRVAPIWRGVPICDPFPEARGDPVGRADPMMRGVPICWGVPAVDDVFGGPISRSVPTGTGRDVWRANVSGAAAGVVDGGAIGELGG